MNDLPRQTAKQVEGAPPVVEDARRPLMTDETVRPRRIDRSIKLMAEKPRADRGRQNRMTPVPTAPPAEEATRREEPPSQEARPVVTQAPESYIRLRLRVEDGEMSVVGIREVEGPLAEPQQLHGGLTYEVFLGRRRLTVGSLPDVGVERSFPNPRGTPEQAGHYIRELPSYEFTVRLPRTQLSRSALPRLEIALYRVKGAIPGRRIGPEALADQFRQELREVSRLKGIRVEKLPQPLQAEFQRVLR